MFRAKHMVCKRGPYWVFKHIAIHVFIIDESLGRGHSFSFHLMYAMSFMGDRLALSASDVLRPRRACDGACAEARHLLVNQKLPACVLAFETSGQAHEEQFCEGRPERKRHILICAARVGVYSCAGRDGIERRGRIYKNMRLLFPVSVYDI